MSIWISLAALLIAAASLWHSSLRPAKLVLDYLPERTSTGSGGGNNFPHVTPIDLDLALVNLGARAGLLKSITIENVRSPGAPTFAIGAEGRSWWSNPHFPEITLDGKVTEFPNTIEARDVRAVHISLILKGDFRDQETTDYLHPEHRERDFKLRAQSLAGLEEVALDVVCRYRRGGGLRGRADRDTTLTIRLAGGRFRGAAARFWRGDGREDLADIVAEEI